MANPREAVELNWAEEEDEPQNEGDVGHTVNINGKIVTTEADFGKLNIA